MKKTSQCNANKKNINRQQADREVLPNNKKSNQRNQFRILLFQAKNILNKTADRTDDVSNCLARETEFVKGAVLKVLTNSSVS